MQIFGLKCLLLPPLPPLLPPLNYMKIRMINAKVAVVAVKSIVYLVNSYWVKELLGYWIIGLLG